MRVILHIGTEKTGTTTIQEFLKINASMLRRQKILVPSCAYLLNSVSHDKIAVYARRENRPDDLQMRLGTEPIDRFRAAFRKDLLAECRKSKCDTVIISSEHCSSRLLFLDEIQKLYDLLSRIGLVDIVLYLRPQEEMWRSYYTTSVKTCAIETIRPPEEVEKTELLDYDALCTRWSNVFNKNHIRVRVFDPTEFVCQSLIFDFCTASGLDVDFSSLDQPPPQNRGFDPKILEFLRRFNCYLPHVSPELGFRADPRQGDLLAILESLSSEDRQPLPAEWRQAFREDFAVGNSRVARDFLGREDGVLFGAVETAGEAESIAQPDFTIDDAFEIFAAVWAEKHVTESGRNVRRSVR